MKFAVALIMYFSVVVFSLLFFGFSSPMLYICIGMGTVITIIGVLSPNDNKKTEQIENTETETKSEDDLKKERMVR